MRPLIHRGDEVIVEYVTPVDLRCGDIVTLWDGRSYWTHRFLGWRKTGNTKALITKGDALYYVDPPMPPDQVIGRVAALQREGRRLYVRRRPYDLLHLLIGFLSRLQASIPRGTPLAQNIRGLILLFDRGVYLLLRGISRLLTKGFVLVQSDE